MGATAIAVLFAYAQLSSLFLFFTLYVIHVMYSTRLGSQRSVIVHARVSTTGDEAMFRQNTEVMNNQILMQLKYSIHYGRASL